MKVSTDTFRVNHCTIPNFWPEGDLKPCIEVRSLCLAKCLVRFELGTFQIILNALTRWATFEARIKIYQKM